MSKKLIILYTANYCNKMRNVFEVDALIKEFNVEFWNLSKITAHENLAPAHTEGLKEINVESHSQFYKLVKENRKESPVYATVIGYSYFSYKVFLILTLFKCKLVWVSSGALPSFPMKRDAKVPLYERIQWLTHLFPKVLYRTPLIKAADYFLVSCNKVRVFYKMNNQTKRIDSNSGDYIDALNIKKNELTKIENDYIVFLDQYSPFHTDYDLLGLKRIDADYYFKTINEYFRKLEDHYKCEVVIAAHPSAEKYKEYNFFEGRKVFFNQTATLVLNSTGVLTHNTTAVSYAVIYEKPIIFMSLPGFCDYDYGVMGELASELSSKIIDISKSDDVSFDSVPNAAYEQYRMNYLSKVVDGTTNAQILSTILNS